MLTIKPSAESSLASVPDVRVRVRVRVSAGHKAKRGVLIGERA